MFEPGLKHALRSPFLSFFIFLNFFGNVYWGGASDPSASEVLDTFKGGISVSSRLRKCCEYL